MESSSKKFQLDQILGNNSFIRIMRLIFCNIITFL